MLKLKEYVDVVGSLSPPEQQEALWDGGEKPGNSTGETDEARGPTGESSVWPFPNGTLDVIFNKEKRMMIMLMVMFVFRMAASMCTFSESVRKTH